MKIRFLILAAVLVMSCQQPNHILLTIDNLPSTAKSVRVLATHGELASIANLPPFELPQPTQSRSTLLLIFSAEFSGNLAISVGAFTAADGTGCLVATGNSVNPNFLGPDEPLQVFADVRR